MKYNELQVTKHKHARRVGRGISAGQGKTAGRGTKGQKSRTGSSRKPGFEGGQNPLMQRLPKLRGFTSHRTQIENVYTGQLDALGANIDNHKVAEHGLVSSAYVKVKLISKGEVKRNMTVKLQSASAGAIKQIEKAGGAFTAVPQVARLKKETKQEKTR